jgi:uncharacterized protein
LSREKLKALEELQKIDLQIRELAAQAEQHPLRLKQIETDKSQAKSALDALRGRIADNERARRQQGELLGLEKEKVRKWEARLTELKTPREYAALARELDIAKKTNQTAEQEVSRLTGEYDELKKGLAAAEQVLAEKDGVAQREGVAIQGQLSELQEKMKELGAERTQAAKAVEAGLLAKYERIRTRRGGVAVAAVSGGTCKGCQMNIPPQMANMLRRGEEIQNCPSCQRFIYAAEPATPAPAAE